MARLSFTAAEIEAGTGVATAIVYANKGSADPVANATAYLKRQGLDTLDGLATDELKEEACVKGTEFVEAFVGEQVLGFPTVLGQGLLMPRSGLVKDHNPLPTDEVPRGYLEACWHAWEWAASGESLSRTVEDSKNLIEKEIAGAITKKWTGVGSTAARHYPIIEAKVQPFMKAAGKLMRG